MAKKGIWEIIEIPVYAMILSSICTILLMSFTDIATLWIGLIGWVIMIGAYGYIGYSVHKNGEGPGPAAKAGALAGAIVGAAGAVLGIVSFYVLPQMYTAQIAAMAEQGVPEATAQTMMSIGVYVGLVTGPLFGALLGAAISAVSNWLSKYI